jgi:hypothetical protein
MCFAAPASFTAAAVLAVAGSYCVKKAVDKDRDYLFFAAVPIFFGIQQLIEGFVWIGLGTTNHMMVKIASLAFLFFAFGFWPFFAPYSVHVAEKREKNPEIKDLLWILTLVGLGVGLATYLPLLLGRVSFTTEVISRSISYTAHRAQVFNDLFVALYLMAVIPPFLIVNDFRLKIFGYLLMLSVIISEVYYRFAFDSVWCFFAAILSLYIAYVMYKLPRIAKPGA